MINKKMIVMIASVAAAFALLSCDGPADKESLRWRSAVDVPVNVEMKVGGQIPFRIIGEGADSVLLDMAADVYSFEEQVKYARKFDSIRTQYYITIENPTDFALTFYALFAPEYKWVQYLSMDSVYNLAADPAKADMLLGADIVNLLGVDGLRVPANDTVGYSDSLTGVSTTLANIIINSPDPIAWRWVAKVSGGDYESIRIADTAHTDAVNARFRLRVRGISNMDSLFTVF